MKRSLLAAGFLLVAPVLTRFLGCSDPEAQSADAGAIARDGAKDVTKRDAVVDTGPCGLAGYVPDDAYAPSCGFCYASTKESLPAPITWKACDPNSEPKGMVCRQMVEDWTPGKYAPLLISPFVVAWAQPNDAVTFVLSRLEELGIHRIVVDADGPVHQAILETTNTCTLGQFAIQAGKVAYRVYDSEAQGKLSSYGGGSMGGAIDDLRPRVYTHYHDKDIVYSYYASSTGLLEISTVGSEIKQYDWATGAYLRTVDSAAQNGTYAIRQVWPVGDAIFTDAYIDQFYMKLRVWTLDGGARDFISFGGDWTKSAGNLASDGVSLVWSQGEGRTNPNLAFDQARVMRTDFTTNPPDGGKLVGTTSSSGAFTNPGVVGCGYVARQGAIALDAGSEPQGVLLFRLSDGKRWELPNVPGSALRWGQPLAITCTELFALATVDGTPPVLTLARVRLDSIGPGQ